MNFKGSPEEAQALDSLVKLTRATNAVSDRIHAHLLDHQLTISQFGVLEAIYHLGPMQTGELGEKILKTSGNMTLVIDNLVKRGLVYRQRRADDRRCVDIDLTEAGMSLITEIWDSHLAGVVNTFSVLSTDEQVQLAQLCRKLGLANL